MAKRTNDELLEDILAQIGGADNVQTAANCMTRMRVRVKDGTKVNHEVLKRIEGVLGVVDAGTLQIVVGPGTAKKITDLLIKDYSIAKPSVIASKSTVLEDRQLTKADVKANQKKGRWKKVLEPIANIFIPLIPAIIAAGLFQGFGSLIATLIGEGTLNDEFWQATQTFFTLIGNSFLGYFAIYTGVNAAKEFQATEALGGMLGAISIAAPLVDLSTQLGLYDAVQPLNSILTTGKGGIIGVIIGVWLLAWIEKNVRKGIPDVFDMILTPVITLFISGLMMVFLVMPVSGVLSDWLISFLSLFIGSENLVVSILSGYVLSAIFLPMVLLGLHHGLIPIYAIQLETFGGVSLFPVLAMAGAGQVGAAIAIYRIARKMNDTRMTGIISGGLPAGILGIGEPLIYGVTLPLGKPFITAGLGAGFGGAYVMMMGVTAGGWGPSGWVALPLMQGTSSMLHYGIGLLIAYVAGFLITQLVLKEEDLRKAQ